MTGKVKKILEEIHPLLIIREVQKWPALYVKDCPERAYTHFRTKIWCEVAKALFPEWDTYSNFEKDNKITDLSKKWRNLRDTYKRQVEIERKVRDGHAIKKKPYVYYKHMAFLHPHIGGDSDAEDASPAPDKRKKPRPRDQPPWSSDAPSTAPAPPPCASVYIQDIDEDKHFLMSLIPSLKKMTEDEKLTAKVEILKAIKSVRSGSSSLNYHVVDSLAYGAELEGLRDNEDIKKEIFAEVELADEDAVVAAESDDDA